MIKLTILVDDIDNVISIFTHIRLYTSDSENGTYTHLAYVPLVAGKTTYYYDHVEGTEDTWYKSSYYNMNSGLESSLSEAVQGVSAELYHYPIYPSEIDFSSTEKTIIRKIRRLIGDLKNLERIYITDSNDELNYLIQNDNKTIELDGNRGWPVFISLNDVEKTNGSDPIVQGYKWATFSGTLDDSSYPIDIYFYTFNFSDREIIESYNDSQMPPGITSSTINQDMLILQSAIDLLESQAADNIMNDGAAVQDDNSSYNPGVGVNAASDLLQRLRKQLDNLVRQYIMSGITGILID